MRSRILTTASVIVVAGVIGLLATDASSWGQSGGQFDPSANDPSANYEQGPGTFGAGSAGYPFSGGGGLAGPPGMPGGSMPGGSLFGQQMKRGPQRDFSKRLSMLKQRLKHASTDERKEATEQELRKLLGNYFDSDLEMRAQQVSDLKKRIHALEQLIEKREDAKSKIIDLQLEVIRNEAAGLGFYSTTNNPGSFSPAPAGTLGSSTPSAAPVGGDDESFGYEQGAPPATYGPGSQPQAGGPTGPEGGYGEDFFGGDSGG